MRPVLFVMVSLGFLAACAGPDSEAIPVTVVWMDWPAEVNAGEPFRTRLIVGSVCAENPQFRAGASSDNSAVTLSPYYLIDAIAYCVASGGMPLVAPGPIDTVATVSGLFAVSPRSYAMRGAAPPDPAANTTPDYRPTRTFGNVIVRPSGADQSRRNAAGDVSVTTDTLGCTRIRPGGSYRPEAWLVLEDQADTAGLSTAFVRGYVYDTPTPVCGETRVFHLEST